VLIVDVPVSDPAQIEAMTKQLTDLNFRATALHEVPILNLIKQQMLLYPYLTLDLLYVFELK
jgi:hypothetical protein